MITTREQTKELRKALRDSANRHIYADLEIDGRIYHVGIMVDMLAKTTYDTMWINAE